MFRSVGTPTDRKSVRLSPLIPTLLVSPTPTIMNCQIECVRMRMRNRMRMNLKLECVRMRNRMINRMNCKNECVRMRMRNRMRMNFSAER